MKLSKMYSKATQKPPKPGEKTGTCCICQEKTKKGHPKKFSANFTATDQTSTGDVICEHCILLKENSNELRRTMWTLTEDKFQPFKRPELPEILENPPDKPYYLYLTRTYKKTGWAVMDGLINQPDSRVVRFACDMDIFTIDRIQALKTLDWIKKLIKKYKFSKTELKNGEINIKKLMKTESPRKLLITLKSLKEDPTFELLVDMVTT